MVSRCDIGIQLLRLIVCSTTPDLLQSAITASQHEHPVHCHRHPSPAWHLAGGIISAPAAACVPSCIKICENISIFHRRGSPIFLIGHQILTTF